MIYFTHSIADKTCCWRVNKFSPIKHHPILVSWRNFQRMLRWVHVSGRQATNECLNAANQMRRRCRRPSLTVGQWPDGYRCEWPLVASGWQVQNCTILFSMRCSTKGLQSRANHLGRISPQRTLRCTFVSLRLLSVWTAWPWNCISQTFENDVETAIPWLCRC